MKLFKAIGGFLKETPLGTLAERAIDRILPDKLSEGEKAALTMEMERLSHERDMQIMDRVNEAEQNFNQRIKDMEGTASDLKAIPFIGSIVLFLRGLQRPLWGFSVLWMDLNWFSGSYPSLTDRQEACMLAINILVLGFLFGERALKNVMPLLLQWFGRKAA